MKHILDFGYFVKNCEQCNLYHYDMFTAVEYCGYHFGDNRNTIENSEVKPEWCPLIEVGEGEE